MISKGEKVKLAMSLGIEVEVAIALFDALDALELPKADAAKKLRNLSYYEGHKDELKAKREIKKIKQLSADLSPIKSIKPIKPGRFLAKMGSAQYDAWNAYTRDTTGKGLPYSDKHNGWWVSSEWPPTINGRLRPI